MQFTYNSYTSLIDLIRGSGYQFNLFQEEEHNDNVVIMRHDIDVCLEKALEMAELEHSLGVQATYFLLVSGLYYNIFQLKSKKIIQRIISLGHDIGLHFDSTQYCKKTSKNLEYWISKERDILTFILENEANLKCVAEHIPNKNRLGGKPVCSEMLDAYSMEYFVSFKYLSDSDMHWRENVFSIIESRQFNRIQLLTHPIWYNDTELAKEEILSNLIYKKMLEQYDYLSILCKSNVPRLEDIVDGRFKNYNKRNTSIS